jgi:hypothetical protein
MIATSSTMRALRALSITTMLFAVGEASAECLPLVAISKSCSPENTLNTPRDTPRGVRPDRAPMATLEGNRWTSAAARSAVAIATRQARDPESMTAVRRSLGELQWADAHDWIHNPPEWLAAAKNYRRQGMPIIHLMQSADKNTLLALGVSNHGKPGIYLTQKLPF